MLLAYNQIEWLLAFWALQSLGACVVLGNAWWSDTETAAAVTLARPVLLLTDGYLANGAEPWKIPSMKDFAPFPAKHLTEKPEGFHPFMRDPETLARVWVKPGTPELMHRIGGLEKGQHSGNISYDPANHEAMTKLRAEKIARIASLPKASRTRRIMDARSV